STKAVRGYTGRLVLPFYRCKDHETAGEINTGHVMSGTYFVILAVLVGAGFLLGAQRARGLRGRTGSALHSLPAYHGLYIAAAVLTVMMAIYVIAAPLAEHYVLSHASSASDPSTIAQ